VTESLQIVDMMTGAPLARLGNLSADGLMLISTRAVPEKHVYQVQFPLPGAATTMPRLEVGIQSLWSEAASGEQSHWTGCHIISISPEHRDLLDAWVERGSEGG
jgi:hypothetical protein